MEGADEDAFDLSDRRARWHSPLKAMSRTSRVINPSYSITIKASDSNTGDDSHMALTSTLDVTVMVVDAEDTGDCELPAERAAG